MDHTHHSCAHNALKFCAHCNTVWCQACKVEWRQNAICLLNHYPYYGWPQQAITSFGLGLSSSGGQLGTLGGSTSSAPTPNLTLTCAHGGDS